MHILITRPQDDAAELVTALTARGIETTLEPLLVIRLTPAPAIGLAEVQALLFTSANGVRCFAAAEPRRDLKVFTVGDNSAAEAKSLGFATVESAAGDVRSLADLVTERLHPRDGSLLHAAGSSLAGDLKGQLQAAGFVVNRVVLYDAEPVTELSPATVMNLRLGGIDAVALFSPRTARIFADLWRAAQKNGDAGLTRATALCLSAAVAGEINELGWQRIAIAGTPDRAGMLALIDRERNKGEPVMAEIDQDAAERDAAESVARQEGAADAARGAAIIAGAPTPPRSGRAGAAMLGLIAGALAGGGMVIAEPYWRPYVSEQPIISGSTDTTALTAEIVSLKEQLAALGSEQDIDAEARSRIDALQSEIATWKTELETATGTSATPSATPSVAFDLAPLEGRLEALEGRVASLSEKLAAAPIVSESAPTESVTPAVNATAIDDLAARFAALEGKLATLDTLSAEAATQKAEIETANARLANLDALDGRLKSLEETATALGSELAQVAEDQSETMLKQQRAAALVLSIGQLRGALGADQAYAPHLNALEDLARPDAEIAARLTPILDPLRTQAALGVPTLSQLQASFPATDIAQAATADAAGAAIGVEANWLQQTLNRLSELITVRPVGDVAGEGALAILARAENKLAAGDLAGTVAELATLKGQAADASAAWLAQANARLALEAAAAQLAALSAETLAPPSEPAQSN